MSESNRSGFKQFLVPEKEISLKLVFDNFRNYAIIGGLAALSHWFGSGKASPPPILFDTPRGGAWELNAWVCLGVASVLFILNVLQSAYIAQRLLGFDREMPGTGKDPFNSLKWYVVIFLSVLGGCLSAFILSLGLMLFNLFVYIVWFSVAR